MLHEAYDDKRPPHTTIWSPGGPGLSIVPLVELYQSTIKTSIGCSADHSYCLTLLACSRMAWFLTNTRSLADQHYKSLCKLLPLKIVRCVGREVDYWDRIQVRHPGCRKET